MTNYQTFGELHVVVDPTAPERTNSDEDNSDNCITVHDPTLPVPPLPHDVLVVIFSGLPLSQIVRSCAVVCKDWNLATKDDFVYTHRAIDYPGPGTALERIKRRALYERSERERKRRDQLEREQEAKEAREAEEYYIHLVAKYDPYRQKFSSFLDHFPLTAFFGLVFIFLLAVSVLVGLAADGIISYLSAMIVYVSFSALSSVYIIIRFLGDMPDSWIEVRSNFLLKFNSAYHHSVGAGPFQLIAILFWLVSSASAVLLWGQKNMGWSVSIFAVTMPLVAPLVLAALWMIAMIRRGDIRAEENLLMGGALIVLVLAVVFLILLTLKLENLVILSWVDVFIPFFIANCLPPVAMISLIIRNLFCMDSSQSSIMSMKDILLIFGIPVVPVLFGSITEGLFISSLNGSYIHTAAVSMSLIPMDVMCALCAFFLLFFHFKSS